jgi:hypothetical protein
MMSPPADGASSAVLPLWIEAPSLADIRIEDSAAASIPIWSPLEMPTFGSCAMPWFLIVPEDAPWSTGRYRLVRGPDDADSFQLTGGELSESEIVLTVTLSVETHDPIDPLDSLCASPRDDPRPFSRTAHVSFGTSASADALPMFATAVVDDPLGAGSIATSNWVRPIPGSDLDSLIDLPLEDGADACATVSVRDRASAAVLAERLCAADAPETRAFLVRDLVAAGPALVPGGFGCSVAPDGPAGLRALALSAALAFVRIWRGPRRARRMLRPWRARPPITGTRTG